MSELIEPYLEYLNRIRASDETITKRAEYLHRSDAALPIGLDAATGDELEKWIYLPHYANWTVFTYHSHLASFFGWAANPLLLDEPLDFNPMLTVKRPRKPQCIPHPVTDDQATTALATFTGYRRLAVILAAYAGMRRAEICLADREHVTRQLIRIPVGKGGKAGVVPTNPLIWEAVKDLPRGPLVRTVDGERWTPQALGNDTTKSLTALLGENCGLHRFRHWFGTNVYRQTRDLLLTQQAMRHSSPNSTIGYTLIADEERAVAISALPNLTLAAR